MKPWYLSKTIWANLIGLVAAVGTAAGVDLGLTLELQAQLVGAILAAVNVALRLLTATAIRKPGGAGGGAAIAALFLIAACSGPEYRQVTTGPNPGQSSETYASAGKLVPPSVAGATAINDALDSDQRRRDRRQAALTDQATAGDEQQRAVTELGGKLTYAQTLRLLIPAMKDGTISQQDKAALQPLLAAAAETRKSLNASEFGSQERARYTAILDSNVDALNVYVTSYQLE